MSLRAFIWRAIGRPLFRITPHTAHRTRRAILRAFGANITPRTKFRPSARIDCPWLVTAGELTVVGDHAVLRGPLPISIGDRCVVSQYAVLSTTAADRADEPITLEDDVWVAADTLVMPGSHVKAGAVIGARSYVDGDVPGWMVSVGHPTRALAPRVLKRIEDEA